MWTASKEYLLPATLGNISKALDIVETRISPTLFFGGSLVVNLRICFIGSTKCEAFAMYLICINKACNIMAAWGW